MAAHSSPDSGTTADLRGTQVTSATENWVEQLDRQGLAALAKLTARRHYVLNNQRSRLLNLPNELIVEIGKLLLSNSDMRYWHNKEWFQDVLPLFQTCAHLRTVLHPLRSGPLVCDVWCDEFDGVWTKTLKTFRSWHERSSHNGRSSILVRLSVYNRDNGIGPSTTAAMAAALGSQLYGSLQQPPAVHIELDAIRRIQRPDPDRFLDHRYFISYAREKFMKLKKNVISSDAHRECMVLDISDEEGTKMWEEARAEGLV